MACRLFNTPNRASVSLRLEPSIDRPHSYAGDCFRFLNREKRFGDSIRWDYCGFGKLWNYNLNYFDFLNQPEMRIDRGFGLMQDFINASL